MHLQRSIRTAFSLLVSIMTLVVGLSIAFGASAAPVSATSSQDEQIFVQLINQIRAEKGLQPLVVDGELTNAARSWSSNMASRDSLAHSPDMAAGISAKWAVLGENVGVHGIHDLRALFEAFVDSPSHYRNLIDPRFQYVGVGVVHAPNGKLWTTHRFMATSAPAPVAPANDAPSATPQETAPTTTPAIPTTDKTPPPATNPTTAPPETKATPATMPPATTPAVPKPRTTKPPVAPPATTATTTPPPATTPSPAATPAPASTPKTGPVATTPATDLAGGTADLEQPTESNRGGRSTVEFPIDSFSGGGASPSDDMADLVKPDAQTIETVLIDLMMAGV